MYHKALPIIELFFLVTEDGVLSGPHRSDGQIALLRQVVKIPT